MQTKLYYARIFTPTEVIERGTVVVSDEGRIVYAGPMEDAPRVDGLRMDVRGRIVVPGFIDVHQHGGHGVTFYVTHDKVGDIAKDLAAYSEWVASTGVTGFLCSVSAPSAEELVDWVSTFVHAFEVGVPGAEALGLHLEGPFLSLEKKGAFDPTWLREPSLEELEALLEAGQGWIRQGWSCPWGTPMLITRQPAQRCAATLRTSRTPSTRSAASITASLAWLVR
jgi:N-acetylglucosamine-6-phosphate deacetylase